MQLGNYFHLLYFTDVIFLLPLSDTLPGKSCCEPLLQSEATGLLHTLSQTACVGPLNSDDTACACISVLGSPSFHTSSTRLLCGVENTSALLRFHDEY